MFELNSPAHLLKIADILSDPAQISEEVLL
jgi:hypothetical protein